MKGRELIDLNYHSQYEPKLGFRATVEAIHNIENIAGFFAILASVCPTASYYQANRVPKGLKDGFTFTIPDVRDKQSSNQSFRFDEGDAVVKGFVPT